MALNEIQNQRVERLTLQLTKALTENDFEGAKRVLRDLKPIFESHRMGYRYQIALLKYCSKAIEFNKHTIAEFQLIQILNKVEKTTRMYLEASVLMAICKIRNKQFEEAYPYIQFVLTNTKYIKSDKKRENFRKEMVDRFDEETILSSIKDESTNLDLNNESEIVNEITNSVTSNSQDDLFNHLGLMLPAQAKLNLMNIDGFAKNQLPSAERLKLPSPKQFEDNITLGKKVFTSIKLLIHQIICNPDSRTYTFISTVNKGVLLSTLIVAFKEAGITIKTILIPAVSLISCLGLDHYCLVYKPKNIMDLR